MTWGVEWFDLSDSPWLPPAAITVAPQRLSATATGGCDRAVIRITGPVYSLRDFLRVLRYRVHIRNPNGALVWWGYVHEVSVTSDGATDSLSLDEMYNSVRVIYARDDEDGAPVDEETAAATDADSIARYGTREMLYSVGDADAASAEKVRDKFLALHAWPLSPDEGASLGDEDEVIIECRGWWHTLGWEYYADPTGREVFDASSGEQVVGWKLESTEVAFTKSDKGIYHKGVAFRALNAKDKIKVSGSASNDGVYTIESGADSNKETQYTATSIRFQADEEIYDDDNSGLGILDKNDFFQVSGSTSGTNDRYWRLNEASANKLVIQKWWSYNIVTQAKGPSITLTRFLKMRLAESVNNAYPGSSITITVPGEKVYMKWTPTSGTWSVAEIAIKVRKEGTPADNIKVELCANSSGTPGTVLASGTIAGSSIGKGAAWKSATLNTPVSVSNGTNYHIVVSRTGAADEDHYYMLAVDENLGYAGGSMGLWDGAAWIARAVDADVPFQAWGTRENATQIASMLASSAFVASYEVATTGLLTRHYRDGRSTVLDEVTDLIEQGTSGGGGLVARVTPARTFQIEEESAYSADTALLASGNALYQPDGTRCAPGHLPAGQWARRRELPSSESYAKLSPFFIQSVEYDVRADAWRWSRRGIPDVFARFQGKQ